MDNKRTIKDLIDNAQYFGWDYVSMFNSLPEEFIRRHKDEVNWDDVNHYQKFSEEFFIEFADKLDIHRVSPKLNSWADPEKWSDKLKAFVKIRGRI
jgi:hypothetical protein